MSEDLVFQTKNFTVGRHPQPFVSRADGGHLRIFPKNNEVSCINDLSVEESIELIRLQRVVREALMTAMNKRGVAVVWVNLEDLGNWAFKRGERPVLHIHVFGRARDAVKQPFPEAVNLPDSSTGFYDGFEALNQGDMKAIAEEMAMVFARPEYQDDQWGL